MTRAAVLRDPTIASGIGQFAANQERAVTAFALSPNGGLIVTAAPLALVHRDLIVALAARLRLPAVYSYRRFVNDGGLISYGPDFVDQYRQAAG